MAKRIASISGHECVACGCCVKVCPRNAITIRKGIHAVVDSSKCTGCGSCVRECPASVIALSESGVGL
ncbi:MAG: 4Fe-4S binding protein [Clostridiaceae bacterium]|nr:4Fe-4S binding protein [Clostridiaceae bacterium]